MAEKPQGTRRKGKVQDQGAKLHMEDVGDREIPWIDWLTGLVGFPAGYKARGQKADLYV